MADSIGLDKLNLDWNVAIKRVRKDTRDDFWTDPLSYQDLLGRAGRAPADVYPLLEAFSPKQAISYAVPKSTLTVRDAIFLPCIDRVVYQALVDRISPLLDPLLLPTVFSYRLGEPDSEYMFLPWQSQWKWFLRQARSQMDLNQGSILVVTDIARYFETIQFRKLQRQLEVLLGQCELDDEGRDTVLKCVAALMRCVNKWSPYEGYGLPQNLDASSFLGNIFLDCVDKMMEREGYPIIRYMDDIRIVVASERDARLALVSLASHLRDLGLGLNSAKTEIIGMDSDRLQIHVPPEDGQISRIQDVIESRDRNKIQEIIPELVEKARSYVDEGRTDESRFRWCLNNISVLRQYRDLEIPQCSEITSAALKLFLFRPAETDTYSRFLSNAPFAEEHLEELERLLVEEPLLVYEWQRFQLWRLMAHYKASRPKLLRLAFRVVKGDLSSPESAAAALYLGACGQYQDRQVVKERLMSAPAGLARRCMQIAIQELNKSERNAAYIHFREDDSESSMLQDFVKGLAEPVYVDRLRKLGVEELSDAVPTVYQ